LREVNFAEAMCWCCCGLRKKFAAGAAEESLATGTRVKAKKTLLDDRARGEAGRRRADGALGCGEDFAHVGAPFAVAERVAQQG
jgi:hypothetical protein